MPTTGYGQTVDIPEAEEGKVNIPLSSLDGLTTYATCGWNSIRANKSNDGNDIILKGTTYSSGVGTHSESTIVVQLNGSKRFYTLVGIDDEVSVRYSYDANCDYEVSLKAENGNTKNVASGTIKRTDTTAPEIDVDVSGWDYLILKITNGSDNTNSNDHVDWANAYLVQAKNAATDPVVISESDMATRWNIPEEYIAGASFNITDYISHYTLHRGIPEDEKDFYQNNRYGGETRWQTWRKTWEEAHPNDTINDTYSNNYTSTLVDSATSMFAQNYTFNLQAAHTTIYRLYVRKGEEILLALPNTMAGGGTTYWESTGWYFRWYNYASDNTWNINYIENDTTFNSDNSVADINEVTYNYDIIRPVNTTSSALYKTADGYVSGEMFGTSADQNLTRMYFYYPTDEEFDSWHSYGNNSLRFPNITNSQWIVACDASSYYDDTNGGINVETDEDDNVIRSTITEPSLSQRVIFIISGIDDDVDDGEEDERGYDKIEYWKAMYDQCVAATNGEEFDYYENYTVSFPYRRMWKDAGGQTGAVSYVSGTEQNIHREYIGSEMVSLNYDARYLYVPGGNWGEGVKVTLDENTAGIKFPNESYYNTSDTEYTIYGGGEDYSGNLYRTIPFRYPNTITTEGDNYETQTVDSPNSYAYFNVTRDGIDLNGNPMTYKLARIKIDFLPEQRLLSKSEIEAIDKDSASTELMRFATLTPKYLSDSEDYREVGSMNFNYPAGTDFVQDKIYYKYPMNWDYSSYGFYDGSTISNSVTNKSLILWGQYGFVNTLEDDASYGAERASDSNYFLKVDASDQPGHVLNVPIDGQVCAGAEITISAWVKNGKGSETNVQDDAGLMFSLYGVTENADGTTTETALYRFQTGQMATTRFMSRYNYKDEWLHFSTRFINGDVNYNRYYIRLDNRSFSTNGADFYVDEVRVYVNNLTATAQQISPTCESTGTKIQLKLNYDQLLARMGMTENTTETTQTDQVGLVFVNVANYENWLAGKVDGKTHTTTDSIAEILFHAMKFYDASKNNELSEDTVNMQFLSFTNYFAGMTAYNDSLTSATQGNGPSKLGNNYYWLTTTDEDGERYLTVDINAELQGGTKYYLVMATGYDASDANNKPYFSARDVCDMYSEFTTTSTTVLKVNGQVVDGANQYCSGQVNTFSASLVAYAGTDTLTFNNCYFDWYIGKLTDFETAASDDVNSLRSALSIYRNWYPTGSDIYNATPQVGGGKTALTEADIKMIRDSVEAGKLYLYQRVLSYRLTTDLNGIVAAPVPFEDNGYLFCWDPVALTLKPGNSSPVVYVGYENETYPDNYDPALRIGLSQLQSATDKTTNYIKIPLRDIVLTKEGDTGYLQLIDSHPSVYLLATDDPRQTISGGQYDIEVGKIDALQAVKDGTDNYITFHFLNDSISKFREGYTYTLMMMCEEIVGGESTEACYGTLLLPVKVVPEYLRWIGDADDNWSNDDHWRRSTATELHKTDADSYDYTPAPATNFVPMSFSKVTIPEGAQVQLYQPTALAGTNNGLIDLTTTTVGSPTHNIEYDFMATEETDGTTATGNLVTEPFYTNVAEQIHFEPQSEMLHTELLDYDKAWVDYKLNAGEWYALASPLQNVFAGDFYAPSDNGRQETEYFQDIEFSTTSYNRFAPAIYQRSWDGAQATNYNSSSDGDYSKMAMEGYWSSVYNDVDVEYSPMTGFSLKAAKGQMASLDSVLIRLPKADESYTYYYNDGTTTKTGETAKSVSLSRTNTAGSLIFEGDNLTTTITDENKTGYYLVGNPFMAHLDMKKFFDANTNLQAKYWTVNNGNQKVFIGDENNGSWITTNGTGTTNPQVEPLQSFFVTLANGTTITDKVTVTFTKDMQALGGTTSSTTSSSNEMDFSPITLTVADGGNSALIIASEEASADYDEKEDAEILLDSNLESATPYSVAGSYAASINSTRNTQLIPIGIFGASGETVKVTVNGISTLGDMKLYDATTGKSTYLSDGDVVEMVGEAHGRYYLMNGDLSSATASITVYSTGNNQLVIASPATALKSATIYTPEGRRCDIGTNVEGKYSAKYTLNKGLYIVNAENENGEKVYEKVKVY